MIIYHVHRYKSKPLTSSCLVFGSVLQQDTSLTRHYLTTCSPHYCVLDNPQRLPSWLEGLLLSQPSDSTHQFHELFMQATCTVIDNSSHNTTRYHRSGRDLAEGGESLLPIELETVSITNSQRKLTLGLIDAMQQIIPSKSYALSNSANADNDAVLAAQTLYAFFVVHSKVEIPTESWRERSCDMPPIQ